MERLVSQLVNILVAQFILSYKQHFLDQVVGEIRPELRMNCLASAECPLLRCFTCGKSRKKAFLKDDQLTGECRVLSHSIAANFSSASVGLAEHEEFLVNAVRHSYREQE